MKNKVPVCDVSVWDTYPAKSEPAEIEIPFGIRCAPVQNRELPDARKYARPGPTSFARARKQHCLEPRREVVHDREIARRNEEVTDSDQHGNLLLEQEGRQNRLGGNLELDVDEEQCEDDGGDEGAIHRRRAPL